MITPLYKSIRATLLAKYRAPDREAVYLEYGVFLSAMAWRDGIIEAKVEEKLDMGRHVHLTVELGSQHPRVSCLVYKHQSPDSLLRCPDFQRFLSLMDKHFNKMQGKPIEAIYHDDMITEEDV